MPTTQITGSPWQSSWTTGYPKLAPTGATTFSIATGGVIVVAGVCEAQSALGTPTNAAASGAATITWTQRGVVTTASRCWAGIWTGSVTTGGNVQVSCAQPGAGPGTNSGIAVWAFDSGNHGGVGAVPAGTNSASGAPSLTATWTAGSTVCCANGDFNAGVTTGLTYRTGNGAATQVNASQVDTNYTTEAWYHASSAGGSQAVGQSVPSTQAYSLVAVEVLEPAGGAVAVNKIPRPRAAVFRSVR